MTMTPGGDALTLSLVSIPGEAAVRYPQRIAIVDREREYTYADIWREILIRARALRDELGVEPGSHVALMAPNGLNFVAEYYAILACGGVVVPMAPMLVTDEVEAQLRDSDARSIIVEQDFAQIALPAAERVGIRTRVIEPDFVAGSSGEAELDAPVSRHPLDPAVLFYTSGTTGRPKGAVLTHLNLVMNCFTNAFLANSLGTEDVVLGCLPLFHTYGQTVAMSSSFLSRSKLVLQRRFDAAEAIDLMRRHGVNVFIGVPTMYIALLEAIGDQPPVQLRMCISGGAPLPVAVLERFEQRFGCPVQEGYGLSETSPSATVNHTELGIRAGTIGQPLWGIEVEIARADLEDRVELLGPGELGEIVIRGHSVFTGYYRQPEATAAAIVDGWFRTGDLGIKDEDGFRSVVDRKKDMIIRGGYNVYPREVEEVVARHPAVAAVGVVGVPDDKLGEEVLAAVVLDARAPSTTPEELSEWMQDRIAHHKRPRIIRIVDELPLGPSRKILKREIRALYQEGRL
ncbi:MAG TPA: long-chain fatty acid--CoA ligase [Solirubrobacteraceae bacterium]|jgi:long-chain acyl-CoA synthetase|nr:long-chain fatty acid--CoA ligase [Solirubrobacteraceae bacterium]